jgi:hypothetical protein
VNIGMHPMECSIKRNGVVLWAHVFCMRFLPSRTHYPGSKPPPSAGPDAKRRCANHLLAL